MRWGSIKHTRVWFFSSNVNRTKNAHPYPRPMATPRQLLASLGFDAARYAHILSNHSEVDPDSLIRLSEIEDPNGITNPWIWAG